MTSVDTALINWAVCANFQLITCKVKDPKKNKLVVMG